WMAKSVVHLLEVIEVEAENSKPFTLIQKSESICNLLAEEMPIGQIGQPIMHCHMGDYCFSSSTLGDVFVRGNPTAAVQRPLRDKNLSPVRGSDNVLDGLALRQFGDRHLEPVRIDGGDTFRGLITQKVRKGTIRCEHLSR